MTCPIKPCPQIAPPSSARGASIFLALVLSMANIVIIVVSCVSILSLFFLRRVPATIKPHKKSQGASSPQVGALADHPWPGGAQGGQGRQGRGGWQRRPGRALGGG